MSNKSAKEILFKALATVDIDIHKHAIRTEVISDFYYNQYYIGQENEFNLYLNDLYKAFIKDINTELANTLNPIILLEGIKADVKEVSKKLQDELNHTEEIIEKYPIPVPQQMKTFFNDMSDIQLGYMSKVEDLVSEKLHQLRPEPQDEVAEINNGGLTLDINLEKTKVVALFLLLQGAGIINNKSVAKFLNTYVKWREFDDNGKPIYKRVSDASNPIWKLKNSDLETEKIINEIKEKIITANIEINKN